jgi:hypothetical protein
MVRVQANSPRGPGAEDRSEVRSEIELTAVANRRKQCVPTTARFKVVRGQRVLLPGAAGALQRPFAQGTTRRG